MIFQSAAENSALKFILILYIKLQHLRNQYWSFAKDTARKQWFKELLLPGVPDKLDPEEKQFTLNDFPICNFIKLVFSCSNNMLIGMKGTNWAK